MVEWHDNREPHYHGDHTPCWLTHKETSIERIQRANQAVADDTAAVAGHFAHRWPNLRGKAKREPLAVDISDFSDEYVAGFLAGQVHMLDYLADAERDREAVMADGLIVREDGEVVNGILRYRVLVESDPDAEIGVTVIDDAGHVLRLERRAVSALHVSDTMRHDSATCLVCNQ